MFAHIHGMDWEVRTLANLDSDVCRVYLDLQERAGMQGIPLPIL